MDKRDVLGRTIIKVDQERHWDKYLGRWVTVMNSLTLDNGTVLIPHPHDDGVDTYVEMTVQK